MAESCLLVTNAMQTPSSVVFGVRELSGRVSERTCACKLLHWSALWTANRNSDSKGDRFIAVSHLKIGAGLHQLTDFGVEFLFFLLQTQHPFHPFHWRKGHSAGFSWQFQREKHIHPAPVLPSCSPDPWILASTCWSRQDFSCRTCSIALRTWRFCASFGFHLSTNQALHENRYMNAEQPLTAKKGPDGSAWPKAFNKATFYKGILQVNEHRRTSLLGLSGAEFKPIPVVERISVDFSVSASKCPRRACRILQHLPTLRLLVQMEAWRCALHQHPTNSFGLLPNSGGRLKQYNIMVLSRVSSI